MNKIHAISIVNCVQLYMDNILDSSSSSSSEEQWDNNEDIQQDIQDAQEEKQTRAFLKTINAYSAEEFKENFGLSRQTANYLIQRYVESSFYKMRSYQGGKAQLTAEYQMYSFLWFASHNTSFKAVSTLFELSISIVQTLFCKITNFFVETMAKESIVFPNDEEKQFVASEFEKISGFPNVLGCIDACYISIRTPKHKTPTAYAGMQGGSSITLQGICDANGKFLNIYAELPSKIHDSRVFKLSPIYKELPDNCCPNYHILGDAAYPLREYLLTPYVDNGSLTAAENLYNEKFRTTSVKIVNAFAQLKSRFKKLNRLDFHYVQMMTKFIIACCAIHNVCIEHNDFLADEDMEIREHPTDLDKCPKDSNIDLLQLGLTKRENLKNYFSNTVNL